MTADMTAIAFMSALLSEVVSVLVSARMSVFFGRPLNFEVETVSSASPENGGNWWTDKLLGAVRHQAD
jgi:hypothetical protein